MNIEPTEPKLGYLPPEAKLLSLGTLSVLVSFSYSVGGEGIDDIDFGEDWDGPYITPPRPGDYD